MKILYRILALIFFIIILVSAILYVESQNPFMILILSLGIFLLPLFTTLGFPVETVEPNWELICIGNDNKVYYDKERGMYKVEFSSGQSCVFDEY